MSIREFSRFVKAKNRIEGKAPTTEILNSLNEMVGLLDKPVLLECELPKLDAEPLALLALDLQNGTASGSDFVMIVAATRDGRLARARVEMPLLPETSLEFTTTEIISDFDPARDQVLGLYWTNTASLFGDTKNLALVLRINGHPRAFQYATNSSIDGGRYTAIGNHVPPWMAVCPVSAEPSRDLLKKPPKNIPSARARGAVVLNDMLWSTTMDATKQRQQQAVLPGEFIHCLHDSLVTTSASQTIVNYSTRGKDTVQNWEWRLDKQPLSLCPVPNHSDGFQRLLVGYDTSTLAVGVVVGNGAIKQLWKDLIHQLGSLESLKDLAQWTAYIRAQLEKVRASRLGRRYEVTTLLRVLLDRALENPPELNDLFIENIVETFKLPIGFEEFLPVMDRMREVIRGWDNGCNLGGTALIYRIYTILPYELQDLFDTEIRKKMESEQLQIPDRREDPKDAEAFELLVDLRHVNRKAILSDVQKGPQDKAAIYLQRWLEPFSLEHASPSRCREWGRMRSMGDQHLILAHQKGLEIIGKDPKEPFNSIEFNLDSFENIKPLVEIWPFKKSVSRKHTLLLVFEKCLLKMGYEIGLSNSHNFEKKIEATQGTIRHAAIAGNYLFLLISNAQNLVDEVILKVCKLNQLSHPMEGLEKSIEYRVPGEFAVLEVIQGRKWLMAHDIGHHRIALFTVEISPGANPLKIKKVCSREVPGRIRSLKALDLSAGKRVLVIGTTEGYIFCLDLSGDLPNLAVLWLYRGRGSIRHLDCRNKGTGFYLLALTAYGDALILNETGRRIWMRRLKVSLRSGAILKHTSSFFVGLVDMDGVVRYYRETIPSTSKHLALQKLKFPGQWEEGKPAYKEMMLLVQNLNNPECFDGDLLKTPQSRACALRFLVEALEGEKPLPAHCEQLFDLVLKNASINEFGRLVRCQPHSIHRTFCQKLSKKLMIETEIVQKLVEEESSEIKQDFFTNANGLLAEMVMGMGFGIITAEWLNSPAGGILKKINSTIRRDPWLLCNLLNADFPLKPAAKRDLVFLCTQAGRLEPAVFQYLEWIVPLEQFSEAKILGKAMLSISRGEFSDDFQVLREYAEKNAGWFGPFEFVISILVDKQLKWLTLLKAGALVETVHLEAIQIPGPYKYILSLFKPFHIYLNEINLQLKDKLHIIDTLKSKPVPMVPSDCPGWKNWLEQVRSRFSDVFLNAIGTYRDKLLGTCRVYLDQLKIERIGSQLGNLTAKILIEGEPRIGASFRLEVLSGFEGLTQPLRVDFTGEKPLQQLAWQGILPSTSKEIVLKSETIYKNSKPFSQHWQIPIPVRKYTLGKSLFDLVPELSKGLIKPILNLKRGFHILAVDSAFGLEEFVAELIKVGSTRVIDLDAELRDFGFGNKQRRQPSLTEILHSIGAQKEADYWQLSGWDWIVAYPVEETTERLLSAPLMPLLQSFIHEMGHLRGIPLLWVLPLNLANRLQTAMGKEGHYHALHYPPNLTTSQKEEFYRNLANGFGTSPQKIQKLWEVCSGNLRLLHNILENPINLPDDPSRWLNENDLLQQELSSLGPLEVFDLLLVSQCHSLVPFDFVQPGQVAHQEFVSTVGKTPTTIVSAGAVYREATLRKIRSDYKKPEFLLVRGFQPGGSNVRFPEQMKDVFDLTTHDRERLNNSHRMLQQRGILGSVNHIVQPIPVYGKWIAVQLKKDPSGGLFVRDLLGKTLVESLALADLSNAGDGLRYLEPNLGEQARMLIASLGAFFAGKTTQNNLSSLAQALTKCEIKYPEKNNYWSGLWEAFKAESGQSNLLVKVIRPTPTEYHHFLGFVTSPSNTWLNRMQDLVSQENEWVLTLLGPGLSHQDFESSQNLCLLTEPMLKEILLNSDPHHAFWRAVRARVGLLPFSPFKVSGYLPAKSPVFVGRDDEVRSILDGIGKTSFLIVGSRRIGKTSLLRHIYGRLFEDRNHLAVWINCQGLTRVDEFYDQFRMVINKAGYKVMEDADVLVSIEKTLRGIQNPVLHMNEIDGLIWKKTNSKEEQNSKDLFTRFRALSEDLTCQFIMVGYHLALEELQKPESPFFHWMEGQIGEKAFILGALSEPAARKLIGNLEKVPLELSWRDEETKSQGYDILLDCSQNIPFLLQTACQSVVAKVHERHSQQISLEDFGFHLSAEKFSVWEYIQKVRPPKLEGVVHSDTENDPVVLYWTDLVLGMLAYDLYFKPTPAPIEDPKLKSLPPENFPFNVAQTKEVVEYWIEELVPRKLGLLKHRFLPWHYQKLLDCLTLTIILAPVRGGNRTYLFHGHIYPLELTRYLRRVNKKIDDFLVEKIIDLCSVLEQKL